MNLENMNPEEIQQLLAKLEQDRINALKALEQRKEQGKYDLAQSIKDMVAEHGYGLDEILPLLSTKKRRSPGSKAAKAATPRGSVVGRTGTIYVDPENADNVYSRGAIPGWMKQKMLEQGYNPNDKAARNAFKANHLKVVGA